MAAVLNGSSADSVDDLVTSHRRLATALARRMARASDDVEELEQVALFALAKAAGRFDPERGVTFSTFAWATVRGELRRHFRDRRWQVHVPRSLQERYLVTAAAVEELAHRSGRSPTVGEVASHLGLSMEDVVEALEVREALRASPLERPGPDGGDAHHLPLPGDGPGTGYELVEQRDALRRLLHVLPDRERRIVVLRFFHELSQSQIAREVGCSQIQVSRLLARSLATLRQAAADHGGESILN